MNDLDTLLAVQSACDEGDIRVFATINMLKRLGRLSKPALAIAKRMIRARFGSDFPPHLLSRAIRLEREKFLHAERAKSFASKAASSLSSESLRKKDRLAVAFGRRMTYVTARLWAMRKRNVRSEHSPRK